MYVKETCIAGDTIEVRKYHTARYCRKGQQRGPVVGRTSEKVQRNNDRYAAMTLTRLINANFRQGDIHMVLTYRQGERPDPADAKKLLASFLRRLRKLYRGTNQELKYIAVTEYESAAIHHHVLTNNIGIDFAAIAEMWPHGQNRPTYLDSRGCHAALAQYFVKETSRHLRRRREEEETGECIIGKRWTCSRNLDKPIVTKEIIPVETWADKPRPKAGYYIEQDSIIQDVSEETGYPYMFYRMIAVRPQKGMEKSAERQYQTASAPGGRRANAVV